LVIQEPNEKLSDDIADACTRVAKLYNRGYRCRFDDSILEVIPLQDGSVCIKRDHCPNCRDDSRRSDDYCKAMVTLWKVISKFPDAIKNGYKCSCPNECKSPM
jgi:hypothetical protein